MGLVDRSDSDTHFDVIVVGAGIAGCAMAHAMGSQGRRVLLLERDLAEPDRIVGELLQPGGVLALHELGMQSAVDGIDAVDVHGYVVLHHEPSASAADGDNSGSGDDGKALAQQHSACMLSYPALPSGQPARGKSFHHGRFVMGLRRACGQLSNVTIVEATVNRLLHGAGEDDGDMVVGVVASEKCGGESIAQREYFAPLTVVADGCYSKFRKSYLGTSMQAPSQFFGLVLHDVALPYVNHGHVVLADPSPILMYQIGTSDTRILVDVPKSDAVVTAASLQQQQQQQGKLTDSVLSETDNTSKAWTLSTLKTSDGSMQEYMRQWVAPQLPRTLQLAFLSALSTQRLRSMPNPYLPSTQQRTRGLLMLGDAHNMRHPLTGGGMTVALNDVVLLKSLLNRTKFPTFANRQRDVLKVVDQWYWRRKNLSSVINILANALYSLFSAGDDPELDALRRATFRYLRLGGHYAAGPVGLLSCLVPRPVVLVYHFFSVALYAVWAQLRAAPWYMAPWSLMRSGRILGRACTVILPLGWRELRGAERESATDVQ
ncbi:Squalene epoxidase [Sorochytrium milnesiophthora]